MSSHFHAGQYNDSFKPTHLRDWRFGAQSYPGRIAQFSCKPRRPIRFIACDNGHLHPNVTRNACTSPWGDYRTWAWEEKTPCSCVHRLRNPQLYTKPRNSIFVTTEMPCPEAEAVHVCQTFNAPPSCQEKKIRLPRFFNKEKPVVKSTPENPKKTLKKGDPILQYLKEQKLPVVWMVGLPTKKITDIRRSFCKTFAENHNFAYIDLDEYMDTWKQRQGSKVKQTIDVPVEIQIPSAFPDWFPPPPALDEENLSIQVSPGKDDLPESAITTRMETEGTRAIEMQLEKVKETLGGGKKVMVPPEFGRIRIDPTEKLGTLKILELLKFAMLESLPAAKGFVIQNFPLDLSDVDNFEKTFYPATLGIYFTETFFRNAQSGRAMGPMRRNVSFQRHYKRVKGFSYEKGDQVVRVHGKRMICIVNAESVTTKTLDVLVKLLDTHLSQQASSDLQLGLDHILSQDSIRPGTEFRSAFENSICIGKGKTLLEDMDTQNYDMTTGVNDCGGSGGGGSYSSNFEEYVSSPPSTGQRGAMSKASGSAVPSWFSPTGEFPNTLEDNENFLEDEDPDIWQPPERIKKRRSRFTRLHEPNADMMVDVGGDEFGRTSETETDDDSDNEPLLIVVPELKPPSVEAAKQVIESDKEEGGYKSDSDSSMTSEQYYYPDDWEADSSGNENEEALEELIISDKMPGNGGTSAKIDTHSVPRDEKQEVQGESSGSDRSYSPESGVELLMTAARMSMQSSSNESMTLQNLQEIRGRSRVRKTKLRTSTSGIDSGASKTVFQYSSAPGSMGGSKVGERHKHKEADECLNSMDAGDKHTNDTT